LNLSVVTRAQALKEPKDKLCFRESSRWVKVSEAMIDLLELTGEISHTLIISEVKSIELSGKLNETARAYLTAGLQLLNHLVCPCHITNLLHIIETAFTPNSYIRTDRLLFLHCQLLLIYGRQTRVSLIYGLIYSYIGWRGAF
jgi:hypothetical protein